MTFWLVLTGLLVVTFVGVAWLLDDVADTPPVQPRDWQDVQDERERERFIRALGGKP
jgi:hypothetical protein